MLLHQLLNLAVLHLDLVILLRNLDLRRRELVAY